MIATHDEILTEIERKVATPEARPDEVDQRVAAELGVPARDYFAYVVVAGAIQRYADHQRRQQSLPIDELALAGGPLEQAWVLVEAIASTAATICLETPGEGHRELNLAAARIYSITLQLRARLRDLDLDPDRVVAAERAALAAAAAPGAQGVVSDGR